MTLNERFVGGNPRVLFLLFCLFCVVLICFVGICPNMMRKSEVFFEAVDQKPNPPHPKRKKKVFFSFKKKKKKPQFFPEGWHGPCQWWHGRGTPKKKKISKKKNILKKIFIFFFLLPHSKQHNLFHPSNLHIYLHSSFPT